MRELIRILEREAGLIEHVLFRLKSVQLLVSADEHRFLGQGSEELHEAAEELGALDAMRALLVEDIKSKHGLPENATIQDLTAVAAAEDRDALRTLRRRLLDLSAQLEAEAASSRVLTLARVAELRKLLERVAGNPGARYGTDGIVAPPSEPSRTVDRRL
ncbi:MAG: flagellar export chaperone FlgN [Candidatus Rokuibacteriota bacterium]